MLDKYRHNTTMAFKDQVHLAEIKLFYKKGFFCRNGSEIPISRKHRVDSKDIIKIFWKGSH